MEAATQREAEEAALSQRLAAASERVIKVRDNFAPKLVKLDERREHACLRETDCNSRQAAVVTAQEELRQQRAHTQQQQTIIAAAMQQAELTYLATRDSAEQWVSKVKELAENAARRRELVVEEEAALGEITKVRVLLKQEVSGKESIAQQMLGVQQQVSRCRSHLASLDAQVPELEEHKKLAVISKNFKEAARLSAEIKALVAQRDALAQSLKNDNATLQQLNLKFTQYEGQQHLLSSQLVAADTHAASLRLKCLRWW